MEQNISYTKLQNLINFCFENDFSWERLKNSVIGRSDLFPCKLYDAFEYGGINLFEEELHEKISKIIKEYEEYFFGAWME